MTLPITGPFVYEMIRNDPTGQNQWFRKKRIWYRQRKPHNLPLSFSMNDDAVTTYTPWGAFNGQSIPMLYYNSASTPNDDTSTALYTKAWSDFRNEVSTSANMALTLLERRQALSMISARTLQFAKFVKEVRSFQFKKAANTLGISQPKGLKRSAKRFGDNVLEYQFGWAPLIGDCYQAAEILSEPFPSLTARGSASMRTESRSTADYSSRYGKDIRSYHTVAELGFRISASIRVINPNLHLASQFGFANPAVLLYESVPFSFVLNWFVTLEDFLSGFYPFPGVELFNTYYTFKGTTTLNMRTDQTSAYLNGGKTPFGMIGTCRRVLVTRTPGAIPGPSLRIRVPWNLSPSRGLNAVSLLLQRLR